MVVDFHAHFPRGESVVRLVELLPHAGIDRMLALMELGKDPPARVDELVREGFRGFKITNPRASYEWNKVLFGADILAIDKLIPSRQFHDLGIQEIAA